MMSPRRTQRSLAPGLEASRPPASRDGGILAQARPATDSMIVERAPRPPVLPAAQILALMGSLTTSPLGTARSLGSTRSGTEQVSPVLSRTAGSWDWTAKWILTSVGWADRISMVFFLEWHPWCRRECQSTPRPPRPHPWPQGLHHLITLHTYREQPPARSHQLLCSTQIFFGGDAENFQLGTTFRSSSCSRSCRRFSYSSSISLSFNASSICSSWPRRTASAALWAPPRPPGGPAWTPREDTFLVPHRFGRQMVTGAMMPRLRPQCRSCPAAASRHLTSRICHRGRLTVPCRFGITLGRPRHL